MPQQFTVNVEGAVFNDAGEWLMVMRSEQEAHAGGTLSLAGGTIDYIDGDEDTLEEALRREFLEEVGIVFGAVRYARSSQFVGSTGLHILDVVLVAPHVSGEPRALDPREVSWAGWLPYDTAMAHPRAEEWTRKSLLAAEAIRRSWDKK